MSVGGADSLLTLMLAWLVGVIRAFVGLRINQRFRAAN